MREEVRSPKSEVRSVTLSAVETSECGEKPKCKFQAQREVELWFLGLKFRVTGFKFQVPSSRTKNRENRKKDTRDRKHETTSDFGHQAPNIQIPNSNNTVCSRQFAVTSNQ
ncbi:MAG: hypothetical protein DSY83_11105 [Flavobacteriia bacterium]|nr:MAG: hypothetical protein DSY83_11105 [Flavobacteriia bacterium]